MSDQFLRLVYASRATFTTMPAQAGIDPEVARILMQSRRNNPRDGLVGALHYADGCFFQALEGTPEAVDALYARLHKDPRHHALKVISRQVVRAPTFSGWAMKYVPNASEVAALLARHGHTRFDPYTFDAALTQGMVDLLLHGPDADAAPAPARAAPRGIRREDVTLGLALAGCLMGALSLGLLLLR